MKSSKMLFGAVALLIPLIVLNAWIHTYLIHEKEITILLVALLIALSTDLLIVYIREQSYAKKMDNDETKATSRLKGRLTTTMIYLKSFRLGILLLLAAWLNIYILLLLICLIPLEVLCFRLLSKELGQGSKIVLEQTAGTQDIVAIAEQVDYLDISGFHGIWTLLQRIRTASVSKGSSMALHVTNIIARTVIIVLAIYDLTINGNPVTLVLYVILIPLFFSTLGKIVYGNISKLDLLNSIHFVDEMRDKLGLRAE